MRMEKVIFEYSCECARACILNQTAVLGSLEHVGNICGMVQRFQNWTLDHVMAAKNEVAQRIANSVTAERRYQSYIAAGALTG